MRKKRKGEESAIILLPRDVMLQITRYLDNKTTISLLRTCRMVYFSLFYPASTYLNLFTSFTLRLEDDITDSIRRYLQHRDSIQTTTIVLPRYGSGDDLIQMWPFSSRVMRYVKA